MRKKVVPVAETRSMPARGTISYFDNASFVKSLKGAFLLGGVPKKRYDKVRKVLENLTCEDPFKGLSVTNNRESRIKNCVKYDLGDGWRLVTQQADKTCVFLFMGDHDDTDRWLDGHKGETFGVQNNRLIRVPGVGDETPIRNGNIVEFQGQCLADMLASDLIDYVLDGLPSSVARTFWRLNVSATIDDTDRLLNAVADKEKAGLIRTVFLLLRSGNVDGARSHIDLRKGGIAPISDFDVKQMIDVEDGNEVRRIRVGSSEYEAWLRDFEKQSSWQDWFLFMHPEQEKVVRADYPGTSQLSGVSGSGKTCVAVRRAVRLAQAESSRVLLLTLNRSLSGMLKKLIDAVCVDEAVRSRIEVTSFFELCQKLLIQFEPDTARRYEDVTWKLAEHVDEIFREYYRGWQNNYDASVIFPIHKSLNSRAVSGENYVREEFDWIRSAITSVSRGGYVDIDRKGRKFSINAEWRRYLLQGLEGWERKMRAVGVVDYLGLTVAMSKYIEKMTPRYTNILVDEAQDFGTSELLLVRKLVSPGVNDVFLCGDIAQTVLPKERSLANAGLSGLSRERIRQNYRNSREILAASYELLQQNLHDGMFGGDDLEILDPRYANFSGALPMALAAETLEEEIAYARNYARTRLAQEARTVCVAFAGFSSRDVRAFAKRCGVTALDGTYDPSTDRLVFSDLEQTKGYEFDTLIVVNCSDGALPARDALPEETFREACKLYVTMTRAKRELILSFHETACEWIRNVKDSIAIDRWDGVEALDSSLVQGVPDVLPELDAIHLAEDKGALNGVQYLYTSSALGLSLEAQDKLVELVDGRGAKAAGSRRRVRWTNVRELWKDVSTSRRSDLLIGPKVVEELRANLGAAKI
jgi:hypothetical protein